MLMIAPEPRAGEGLCNHFSARLARVGKRQREPLEPRRYIACTSLRLIECVVVFLLAAPHFGGNAVQPRWPACILGESHVDDCTADAAVPVFKGVDGLEPDVRKSGSQDAVQRRASGAVEPLEEVMHLGAHGS